MVDHYTNDTNIKIFCNTVVKQLLDKLSFVKLVAEKAVAATTTTPTVFIMCSCRQINILLFIVPCLMLIHKHRVQCVKILFTK